jgi:hypothetical protein
MSDNVVKFPTSSMTPRQKDIHTRKELELRLEQLLNHIHELDFQLKTIKSNFWFLVSKVKENRERIEKLEKLLESPTD